MKYVVTGGYGFIGSALVRSLISNFDCEVMNIDKITYASNLKSLDEIKQSSKYTFLKADILDKEKIASALNKFQPDGIFHLAAESHVDRSIKDQDIFLKTNILGTSSLVEASRMYIEKYKKTEFKFIHVSTDEVFGDLPIKSTNIFTEISRYNPRSPYAASKASSDHIVRAAFNTYDFPSIVTNCSNNYGPWQNPEKLIPLVILRCINNQAIPVYGKGNQIRDWLHVDDHVSALIEIMRNGKLGESYNIGSNNEIENLNLIKMICKILEDKLNQANEEIISNLFNLVEHVDDRPGHDLRYAIDPTKLKTELDWEPKIKFSSGLDSTISWYLDNYI